MQREREREREGRGSADRADRAERERESDACHRLESPLLSVLYLLLVLFPALKFDLTFTCLQCDAVQLERSMRARETAGRRKGDARDMYREGEKEVCK